MITRIPCVLDEMGARYEHFWREIPDGRYTSRRIPVFTVKECPDFVEGPPPPLAATLPEHLAGRPEKAILAVRFRKGGLRSVNVITGGLY
jgi:hypothetical protein